MTASDERVALRGICACAVRISQEEVSDFCSVLSLADRVFVAGSADATSLAALFRLGLHEFGFDAHVLDTTTVRHVEPADTVVAIAGPQPDAALTDIVRIVVDTQAVLLAVATHRTPLLLRRADAAITVPWTAGTESMRKESAEAVFDLMSLVTIHAIRRDLTRRCSRDSPRGAAVDGFSHPTEHLSAPIPHSNTARGSTICNRMS
jgi:D-arabinose 5-phosphate isomerase GutQ